MDSITTTFWDFYPTPLLLSVKSLLSLAHYERKTGNILLEVNKLFRITFSLSKHLQNQQGSKNLLFHAEETTLKNVTTGLTIT